MLLTPTQAKLIPAAVLLVVSTVHLFSATDPLLSPHSRAGMVFGAALPREIHRDLVIHIEGKSFGKTSITPESIESLSYEIRTANFHPQSKNLELLANRLMNSRWQDRSKALELIWNRPFKPTVPIRLDDWELAPDPRSLVEISAVEIVVFEKQYSLPESLNTDLGELQAKIIGQFRQERE